MIFFGIRIAFHIVSCVCKTLLERMIYYLKQFASPQCKKAVQLSRLGDISAGLRTWTSAIKLLKRVFHSISLLHFSQKPILADSVCQKFVKRFQTVEPLLALRKRFICVCFSILDDVSSILLNDPTKLLERKCPLLMKLWQVPQTKANSNFRKPCWSC